MYTPRVLMFGWELPPHNSGGLGVACYGLTKSLSRLGVPIAFALPRRMNFHISFMNVLSHHLQGVEITAINSLLKAYISDRQFRSEFSHLTEDELALYGGSMYDEALRFGEMAAKWSQTQPHQIIHAHDWMTYPAAMRAHRVSGQPWVAHIHATEYDRTAGSVNTQIADLEYRGLNQADRVIAVSHYTKGVVNRHYGVPLERIDVVHNGVDFSEFEPMELRKLFPNDKIVLFVGRLTYQKGVDYLLRAAQQVLAQEPNTIFLVVGHGDLYQKLVMDSARLGIGNRVVFPGFLNGDKLRACYQMADVFIMPSVSEPYGIVALEALATGIPSIISKQSGVGETLDNVLKVDFWDVNKMAYEIVKLLKHPRYGSKLAEQARREASQITWDVAASKTLQVYNSLL